MFAALKERNLWVDFFSIFFGLGEWIAICGIWAQIPMMVEVLPEGWSLMSYFTLVIQLANSSIIVYGLLKRCFPRVVNERYAPFVLYVIGNSGCILLILVWDKLVYLNGSYRSFGLLASVFLIALVDCCSSVVFLPFISTFKPIYFTTYLIGEGGSIFLPGLVSLIQGVGIPDCVNTSFVKVTEEGNFTDYRIEVVYRPPLFSVSAFYGFLLGMMICSTVAFFCLRFTPCVKGEKLERKPLSCFQSAPERNKVTAVKMVTNGVTHTNENIEVTNGEVKPDTSKKAKPTVHVTKFQAIYLLVIQGWLNGIYYGAVVPVQSYSGLPYGEQTFHLVVTLASVANPISGTFYFLLSTTSVRTISILAAAITVLVSYIMATATLSPFPPLVGTMQGSVAVIIIWVVAGGGVAYCKVAIVNTLKHYDTNIFFWVGAASQMGTFVFTIIMFILVNVCNYFVSKAPCADFM